MEMLYEFEFEEDYALGKYPEEDLESLLNECRKNSKLDLYLIEKAFRLCLNMHKDQLRKSGMPYYLHPLKVALIILQELGIYDTQTIVGALLHDTIEDISGDNKDEQREKLRKLLKDEFGNEILDMVESLTKIKHSNISKSLDKAATYRKLFLAIVQDVRVILIKIADRLHNMRTLHYLIERKQKEIAEETLSFYTPMALRLGLTKIKMELEDRSLYFSDRRAYEEIKTALAVKDVNLFSI